MMLQIKMRIFLSCILWILCMSTSTLTHSVDQIPSFTLNFDEPPETRYNAVFTHYRRQIIEMENDMMHSIGTTYRDLFMSNTEKFLTANPEAYYAMLSLANITQLPLWQTLLVNSVVDISSFCTSVVGIMTNGTIIHGRNLDFDFPSVLQPLVYRAFIRSNGIIIGEGACIAGYIGFYTAIRYHAFTVSYNVRMYPHTDMSEITANIMREWEPGMLPAAQAIQAALLQNQSFQEASSYLQTQKVNTPCYIILAGVGHEGHDNEGVVITRDPYVVNRTDHLNSNDHRWYVAQGNSDWWLTSDPRYESTVNYLEALGQEKLTMETLVTEVLNKTGVVQLITIFTASMSAEKNKLDVYLTPLV